VSVVENLSLTLPLWATAEAEARLKQKQICIRAYGKVCIYPTLGLVLEVGRARASYFGLGLEKFTK
jgi:hypothetical protein